nr:hypothetical protein [Tanacetum cinerariifolium]
MFTMIKLVLRHQNTQQFDAMLPVELTNEDIRNSKSYKEYYAIASGAAPPKTKAIVRKTKSSFNTTTTPPTAAGTRLSTSVKGKQPAKSSKANGLTVLSEVEMSEAEQMKLATKKSLQQNHISQASGSGVDEGTGFILEVSDVPTDEHDEEISWESSDEVDDRSNDQEDDDDQDDDDQNDNDDDQDTNNDGDDFVHPKLSIHEEEAEDKESFDPIVQTPKNSDDEGNDDESLSLNVGGEEGQDAVDDDEELYRDVNINLEGIKKEKNSSIPNDKGNDEENIGLNVGREERQDKEDDEDELYRDVNINLEGRVVQMADVHTTQEFEDSHVTLTLIEKTVNEQLEAEVLTRSSNSSKTSYAVAADLSEMELKKILIEKMEGNKSIHRSDEQRNLYKALVEAYKSDKIILDTYGDTVTLKRRRDDDANKDEEPSAGSDRGSKRRREGKELESTSAPKEKATRTTGKSTQGSKYRQTNLQLQIMIGTRLFWLLTEAFNHTLTPKLLAGPTYELMKGSYKSLVELEFFLEEVYKATTDQLDWINPEGQQYPHNLLKPLPLISNSRGPRVIPFDHFINNDLEYLRGGISHWGRKRQQFYGFAVNRKSARDVYSKRRIIAVTELKIVEWHNYKHLDWITVRRDNEKLYKFKEGDFKRLRIQDIEYMLLLLVQGKLTNLTVEELFAFNVSLRMFTRSIVIQRRVEELQLGVKSYQKKLNLIRPDTYRSDLKRKEAYTAYSNPRGFIYQNKDKQNRLMWIDELQNSAMGCSMMFALLWMIVSGAIDKQLKTRRIMRSLERFVGGRLYEGDFRMLQRTI